MGSMHSNKWWRVINGLYRRSATNAITSQAALETPQTAAQSMTSAAAGVTAMPTTNMASDWLPPLFVSPEEASYYVSRLADRRFVTSYGDRNNRRPWYIAAEKLGEIGLPAVPLLFARLNTTDEYEQMLVLYALQLATQDPQLMVRTGIVNMFSWVSCWTRRITLRTLQRPSSGGNSMRHSSIIKAYSALSITQEIKAWPLHCHQ